MTKELKPCPFCGGAAVVRFSHEAGRWDVYEAECDECVIGINGPHGFTGEAAKGAAIERWNTRASQPDDGVIERVARAICQADGYRETENEMARCRDLSIAVLKAIKEGD